MEIASDGSSAKCSYGNIAVLYRRQVKLVYAMLFIYLLTQCKLCVHF